MTRVLNLCPDSTAPHGGLGSFDVKPGNRVTGLAHAGHLAVGCCCYPWVSLESRAPFGNRRTAGVQPGSAVPPPSLTRLTLCSPEPGTCHPQSCSTAAGPPGPVISALHVHLPGHLSPRGACVASALVLVLLPFSTVWPSCCAAGRALRRGPTAASTSALHSQRSGLPPSATSPVAGGGGSVGGEAPVRTPGSPAVVRGLVSAGFL